MNIAIDPAKKGMTKGKLMQHFNININKYYACLKSFQKKDRETLRGLLISNGNTRKVIIIRIIHLLQLKIRGKLLFMILHLSFQAVLSLMKWKV